MIQEDEWCSYGTCPLNNRGNPHVLFQCGKPIS